MLISPTVACLNRLPRFVLYSLVSSAQETRTLNTGVSMERSSSMELNNIGRRNHRADASGPQNSVVQPNRTAPKRRSTDRSRNEEVKSVMEPESVRARSPDRSNSLPKPSHNPETNAQGPEREESWNPRQSRESSYDQSNSFPLFDNPRIPFIPPAPSPVHDPPTSQKYYSSATGPEQVPYTPYSAIPKAPNVPRDAPYTEYPQMRSTVQAPREVPYTAYPGIQSAPQPERQMPYTTYDYGIRSAPQPARQMPYTMYDSGIRSVPQRPRPMPSMDDSGIRSVPQRPRPMPSMDDSGTRFVPRRPSPTPYEMYSSTPRPIPPPSQPYVLNSYPGQQSGRSYLQRARRGDAFVANDPFRPSKGKNESDTYDSFDNMPMDVVPPSVPYGVPSQPIVLPPPQSLPARPYFIPSQQGPISQPPLQSLPTRPPVIPSQEPIILPQPPYIPMEPIIPPERPIIIPQPIILPQPQMTNEPAIPGSQPPTIYPSVPRPSTHETPPLHAPYIPPPRTDSRSSRHTPSPPPIRIPSPPSPPPIRIPSPPARPHYTPISSPTSSSPSIVSTAPQEEGLETEPTPMGRLSPVRRPEVPETPEVPEAALPDRSSTSHHESFGDLNTPIPSEHPYGYGRYFQEHGIDISKRTSSFKSSLRKLFAWPFSRPTEPKPNPYPYIQQPYPVYPPGFVPQVYYPTSNWGIGVVPPVYIPSTPGPVTSGLVRIAGEFVTRTLPTQIYLNFLLRLPSLYFSRVARIFEEADLTLPELKKMALETASKDMAPDDFYVFESALELPPQYVRLKTTWESFIDSIMREWKTFNIISVLLLSAILTILQIQTAEQDPIIRYTALASLICALISLLFGCMYIIRFGSMRKTYKAAEWALEAKKSRTTVWWNVWVLLAMPVVWLVWSIILYIACIMTFIWRTTSQDVAAPLVMSQTTILIIRVVLSSVLGLGIVYAMLIMSTFRRYGETMDNAWKMRIRGWIEAKSGAYGPSQQGPNSYSYPYVQPSVYPYPPVYPMDVPGVNPYDPAYASQPGPMPMYATAPPTPDLTRSQDYGYGFPPDQKNPYPDVDQGKPFGYQPPSETPRNPYRNDSEASSTSTSAYRPFFGSQEPLSHLRPQSMDSGAEPQPSSKPPDDISSFSLPQVPPKTYLQPTDHPKGARSKRRVSVPPSSSLPPIPGTPGTSTLSYLTPVYTDSPPSMGEASLKPDEPTLQPQLRRDSGRVQFRSPLVSAYSAQGTSRTGSQQDVVDSAKSSISGITDLSTNVPWTPFPSPISRDP